MNLNITSASHLGRIRAFTYGVKRPGGVNIFTYKAFYALSNRFI